MAVTGVNTTSATDEDDTGREFEGTGQIAIDEIELGDGPTISKLEYDGDRAMTVSAIPQDDQDSELVIIMTDFSPGVGGMMPTEGPYVFEVNPRNNSESEVEWELAIMQSEADEEEAEEPPVEFGGDGSTVLGPILFEATEIVTTTHEGETWSSIEILPHEGKFWESLYIGSGEDSSQTTVDAKGVAWILVQTDGE